MRRGIAAGLGGMVLLVCGLARWELHSGKVESPSSQESGAAAEPDAPGGPATLQAMTWCGRRHPEAIDAAQPQVRLAGGDPDVEAGFTGHDAEELALGAAMNEQIELTRGYVGQALGISAANLAAAATSGQNKPSLPVKPPSGHAPGFVLPLRNLTGAERDSLCASLASMRQANMDLADSIASANGQ